MANFSNSFSTLLKNASVLLEQDLTGFDFQKNNFLDDELKSQYISYLFSCAIADILKERSVRSSFVSGYSMGLYAALYHCGSVSFKDGLMMVKRAWEVISGAAGDGKYSMGMIIGLEEGELGNLIKESDRVEICNQNNKHTFIISGSLAGVENVLTAARNEGAMRANPIPVSKPYHSGFLRNAGPAFSQFVKKISFKKPVYEYISPIDQQIIGTSAGLKEEVVRNLSCKMNWLSTMNCLTEKGTEIFFECGAGDGLTRNTRFIEGNFKSYSSAKLDKFLEAVTR